MGKKEYGKKEFRGVMRVLVRKNRCIDRTRKRGKKRKYRKKGWNIAKARNKCRKIKVLKKTETRKGGKGQKRKVNNIVVMNETEQKGRIRKKKVARGQKG